MSWLRNRALTLVLLGFFALFLAGQLATGRAEYNETRGEHGEAAVTLAEYLWTGHPWEAIFARTRFHLPLRALVVRPRARRLLVRIVSELAKRVPRDRLDGVAGRVPAAAVLAGVEARPRASPGDGPLEKDGRDGGIRTHGPLTPSQVRYQAALHPELCGAGRTVMRSRDASTFQRPWPLPSL